MDDDKIKDEPATVEEKVDETVEDTFPASDPPSIGGSTGPNDTATTGPKADTTDAS